MTTTYGYENESSTCVLECKKDVEWYITEICGGMDLHIFTGYREANEFGRQIREKCPELDVEINYETVRLRLR